MSKCCNDEEIGVIPNLRFKLVGKTLFVTYNDITQPVDLSTLGGGGSGGGSGQPPKNINVPITVEGQTYFSNVIPFNEILLEITVNGQTYYEQTDVNEEGSYIIIDQNLTWTGAFDLGTTDTLILKTWQ